MNFMSIGFNLKSQQTARNVTSCNTDKAGRKKATGIIVNFQSTTNVITSDDWRDVNKHFWTHKAKHKNKARAFNDTDRNRTD